jgi:hypothetical protein
MNDSIDPQKNLLCQFRLLKQLLELQTQRKEKYLGQSKSSEGGTLFPQGEV